MQEERSRSTTNAQTPEQPIEMYTVPAADVGATHGQIIIGALFARDYRHPQGKIKRDCAGRMGPLISKGMEALQEESVGEYVADIRKGAICTRFAEALGCSTEDLAKLRKKSFYCGFIKKALPTDTAGDVELADSLDTATAGSLGIATYRAAFAKPQVGAIQACLPRVCCESWEATQAHQCIQCPRQQSAAQTRQPSR
jgi:hypothetical protein